MRQIIRIAVCGLCILLGCFALALAESSMSFDSPEQIAALGNSVIVADGDVLKLYSFDSNTESELGVFPGLIALDADKDTAQIAVLCGVDEANKFVLMDNEGRILYDFIIENRDRFSKLKLHERESVAYMLSDSGELYKLVVDGEEPAERFEEVSDGIIDFALRDELIYLLYGGSGEIAVFNVSDIAERARCSAAGVSAIEPFPYAVGRYPVAIWRNGSDSVSFIDVADGSSLEPSIDFDTICSEICVTETALFTLSENGKEVSYIPLSDTRDIENTLFLLNCVDSPYNDGYNKAVELFHQRYPGVMIVERWIDDPRDFATVLMSGDERIDVIYVQEMQMTASSIHLLKSGAILPLDTFECIERLPWDEYAFSRDAFTANDSLYCIPYGVFFAYLWEVNDLLVEEMGITLPDGDWTWDEFFAIAETVNDYNTEHGTRWYVLDDSLSIPSLFYQYGMENNDIWNGKANYTDQRFVDYAAKWQNVAAQGLIGKSEGLPSYRREDALFTICGEISQTMGSRHWILPPRLDTGYAFPIYYNTLEVCANSTHPEMAAYFIACRMSMEALTSSSITSNSILLKDWTKYADADNYVGTTISDENAELWLRAISESHNFIFYHHLYRAICLDFYPALVEGNMTPEEFARACQQYADMVLGE